MNHLKIEGDIQILDDCLNKDKGNYFGAPWLEPTNTLRVGWLQYNSPTDNSPKKIKFKKPNLIILT